MAQIDRIAKQVASGLKSAGMTRKATLVVVTPGTRTTSAVSAGTNPTTTNVACRGLVVKWTRRTLGQTNVTPADRIVMLLGATIAAGVVPKVDDRITIEGSTTTIVSIERDAAAAAYNCLTR